MSLNQPITDHEPMPGGLKQGARPGVDGWYWCQCDGFAAPEAVYFIAPGRAAAAGKVFSISVGEITFAGSRYDQDRTRWYGPIAPPVAWPRVGAAA